MKNISISRSKKGYVEVKPAVMDLVTISFKAK